MDCFQSYFVILIYTSIYLAKIVVVLFFQRFRYIFNVVTFFFYNVYFAAFLMRNTFSAYLSFVASHQAKNEHALVLVNCEV